MQTRSLAQHARSTTHAWDCMTVAGWLAGRGKGGKRGGRPLPCNFKRGKRERGREWKIVLARPFACMHKQGGGGRQAPCGRREGRLRQRIRGKQNNPFAPPLSLSICGAWTMYSVMEVSLQRYQIWKFVMFARHHESITKCKLSVYLHSVTLWQLHFLSRGILSSLHSAVDVEIRGEIVERGELRLWPRSLARSYSAISIFLGSAFFLPPHHPWHHILHTDASPISYLLQSHTRRLNLFTC